MIQVTGYGLWNMGFGLKFLPKPRLADILMTVSLIIDMSRIWTPDKTQQIHDTLVRLYVQEEKTIFQIANLQGITAQTVYSRLKRFGIPTNPKFKKRQDLTIPKEYTAEMAEFFGIMIIASTWLSIVNAFLEPGRVSVIARKVMGNLFGFRGFDWVFSRPEFMAAYLRGLFDTDGTVYKLRWGMQISFKSKSAPLLVSTRQMLLNLGFSPSRVSADAVYLTKKADVILFFEEVRPHNPKHLKRFEAFCRLQYKMKMGRYQSGQLGVAVDHVT